MSNVAQFERRLWILDQQINARGFRIDATLAKKAAIACQEEKLDLDATVDRLTEGKVTSATQHAKLRSYLAEKGVDLPNMQAKTLEKALDSEDVNAEAKQLIEARQRVSKSSTAKFLRVLKAIGPDKRMRGGLQFCGASRTGRWAGRLLQPHNLPRPSRKWPQVKQCISALLQGCANMVTDNVHLLCSDIARSIIVADKGMKLLVADYNAIEGRVLVWLAGEMDKLDAYSKNEDQYRRTYRKMFGMAEDAEISADERQKGKCFELAMGYEGGVGALQTSAKTYDVDLKELGDGAYKAAPTAVRRKAHGNFAFAVHRKDESTLIGKKLWVQLECAKIMWRKTSPKTVQLWKNLNNAAIAAIEHPGKKYRTAKCIFMMANTSLAIRLPSGRCILYANPRISTETNKKTGRVRKSISYVGVYFTRESLYGGKIAENVTSGISRDILATAMLRVDKYGFPIVLTVHDEIIAEVKRLGKLTLKMMIKLMLILPTWATGLPLHIEGYQAIRFRKG